MTSAHQSNDDRIFLKECQTLAVAYERVYLTARGESRLDSGVRVIGCGEPSGRLNRIVGFTKKVYRKALSLDCDVYHLHDPELLPYGVKLAKMGKKVIFDSHEDVPAQILDKSYIPAPLRRLVSELYRRYETYAVSRFAAVVTATPYIADRFRGRAKTVAAINNYPKLDDIVFHTEPFGERGAVVCYAGGIDELRGEKIMTEAMRDVRGTLIIAGDHEQLRMKKGSGEVEYVGRLDRAGVNALYGKAVAGLCMLKPAKNYINSQPIKMYEYMAAGIPFICSDFPKWKKIAERTKAGICVPPCDNRAVSSAIARLLSDRSLGQEMGRRGRRYVEKLYNWEAEGKKLIDLYQRL